MSAATLAVRGGTLVDGTGRPAVRADVGVADGRVVEIGERVRAAEEIDAGGRLVVPGFIDVHTHYDAQALWDPELSPSSWLGVTSVVMGNTGLTVAPVRPEGRGFLLRTLEKVEDMRLATMEAGIEWDFESYGEYLEALSRRGPLINVGGYVGHSAVRVYVMGEDAAVREATSDEVDAMRRLVAEALEAGALGFSTDRAGFIGGADGMPLPSVAAGRAEVEALVRVPGEVGRGIVHVAPGDDYAWMFELDPPLASTLNWSAILSYRPGSTTRVPHGVKMAAIAAGRRAGMDVWAQVTALPIRQTLSLVNPAFLSVLPAFGAVFDAAPAARASVYADPAWRRRAAAELEASTIPLTWDAVRVEESPGHADLVGRTIASIAASRGEDPFDAMCAVGVADGLATRFVVTFANDDPAAVAELLHGEGCIVGLSDAGAHLNQICDAVLPVEFLAGWVRDREVMSLEAGVRKLTGELAGVLHLDRGVLAEGRPADLVVLDMERLSTGPVRRVADMPAGGERLVADRPTGIEAVVVNGVPIRRDGELVRDRRSRAPGRILRPAAA